MDAEKTRFSSGFCIKLRRQTEINLGIPTDHVPIMTNYMKLTKRRRDKRCFDAI
jgi:hypothetical protein